MRTTTASRGFALRRVDICVRVLRALQCTPEGNLVATSGERRAIRKQKLERAKALIQGGERNRQRIIDTLRSEFGSAVAQEEIGRMCRAAEGDESPQRMFVVETPVTFDARPHDDVRAIARLMTDAQILEIRICDDGRRARVVYQATHDVELS